jgi:hypothetical protein
MRRTLGYGFAALAATVIAIAAAVPASAAGSAYAGWTLNAGAGTVAVPVSGFPAGQIVTDASGTSVPGGSSTYLGAQTPFGQVFGSSTGKQYAVIRPAAGNRPSTTTITFAQPTPATGWGFALGDVDADMVRIIATAADGSAVTPGMLGWQGAFNYCQNVPKPSSCGADPGIDVPTWNPTTGTLVGHVADTSGATGWFRPIVPLKSITLTFSVLSGIPIYQVWIAALSRAIGGTLTGGCAGQPADGTLWLEHEDGSPVLGTDGRPISTTPADNGSYSFLPVVSGRYRVRVEPANGMTTGGPNPRSVDVTGGDAGNADFALSCTPPSSPPTTTTPTTTTTPPATPSGTVTPTTTTGTRAAAVPEQPGPLASSGANLAPWLGIGVLLLGVGGCLYYVTRRRTRLGRRG